MAAPPTPPHRRMRRVLLTAFAVMTLAGGLVWVAPSVLTPVVAARLSSAIGADVRIGWITWNPLAGRLGLHRIALAPNAGEPPIATAQAIQVDVGLRRWLGGERRLDALVLRRPWIALHRTATGDLNVARISPIPTLSAAGEPPESAAADTGPPTPFRIGLFRILSGSIEFRDETTTPALETSLHLDDASARDLVLAGDGSAGLAFHVESRLENEPLTLDVTYESTDDASSLVMKLVAVDASLARALLYLPLGWQRTSGTMDATLSYERRTERGVLRTHILRADLALHDLALTEPWADEPMLQAKRVRVPTLTVDLVKQRTDLGAVQLDAYRALVLRDAERLHVPLATGAPDVASDSTWETTLDRVALGKGVAILRNVFASPEVTVPVSAGSIRLPQNDVVFSFAGTLAGSGITLDGRTHGDATTLAFGFDGLDLAAAALLVNAPVGFTKGRLGGTIGVALSPAGATLRGTFTATEASTAPIGPHPEEIFAWQRLDVTMAESTLDPPLVHLERADIVWPYVMVHRRSDGIFPFDTPSAAPRPLTSPGTSAAPPWLRVDHLGIEGGRIEFYDTTLPRAYGIDLTDLSASADGMALSPLAADRFTLKGALDELSPVTVTGRIEPSGTTLDIAIDRLLLAPLNPYLVPALGYEVNAGLARVSSDVRITGSRIAADTDLTLSRFSMRASGTDTVGGRIGTPLSVALALMKDTRGDIHLALPIEGDLSSSEYRVGSLLREALGTALLGTLRAPLGFLRGLFRKDEGERFDLRPVPFPAGSATLGAEGEARLAVLARLLARQTVLRAVLIPAPTRADFDVVTAAGVSHPIDALAALARERGALVVDRLAREHGLDPRRVTIEPWTAAEPDIEGEPGVDIQLRAD
ncbi:MAG: DUF748 domain-containing protein [Deltaproteobacteria bacterium]|nr:DUF748 domain-containing protein [Deltaproteobacteria bacterium]